MNYKVIFEKRASKELSKLEKTVQRRIVKVIEELTVNPRPNGSKKLSVSDDWRIRIGDYRVVYRIEEKELIVIVIKVGHRREVYR